MNRKLLLAVAALVIAILAAGVASAAEDVSYLDGSGGLINSWIRSQCDLDSLNRQVALSLTDPATKALAAEKLDRFRAWLSATKFEPIPGEIGKAWGTYLLASKAICLDLQNSPGSSWKVDVAKLNAAQPKFLGLLQKLLGNYTPQPVQTAWFVTAKLPQLSEPVQLAPAGTALLEAGPAKTWKPTDINNYPHQKLPTLADNCVELIKLKNQLVKLNNEWETKVDAGNSADWGHYLRAVRNLLALVDRLQESPMYERHKKLVQYYACLVFQAVDHSSQTGEKQTDERDGADKFSVSMMAEFLVIGK